MVETILPRKRVTPCSSVRLGDDSECFSGFARRDIAQVSVIAVFLRRVAYRVSGWPSAFRMVPSRISEGRMRVGVCPPRTKFGEHRT